MSNDLETPITILRSPHDSKHKFTLVSNELIRDSSVSFKARMLLIYLLSMDDSWILNPKAISKHQGIGKHQIYTALKELIDAGYIRRTAIRNGKYIEKWVYEISESKRFKNPSTSNPELLPNNQEIEDQEIENRDIKKYQDIRNTKELRRGDPPPEQNQIPKKKIGTHVTLTEEDQLKLYELFGKTLVDDYIERVNDYCASKGTKYKDYAATIRNWIKRDKKSFNNFTKTVDRRTKNLDGSPVETPYDNLF
jgi:predicted transcriptional regulator